MKYEISDQEFQIIAQALGELPLKISGPVFGQLMQQKQETQQAPTNHSDKEF
jgi:hypothetical protein